MDHHTVAAVSIAGTCLDVIGSLYLAYDLLGGRHGPLRLLTRAVTYSVVFGVGYGLGLGLFFGLASGVASGITIAIELNRAARGLEHYSWKWEGFFSAIRSVAFGVGLYVTVGLEFAAAFAILLTLGRCLRILAGCVPRLTMQRPGSRGSHDVLPGESCCECSAILRPRCCAALWCSALTTRGGLRFASG